MKIYKNLFDKICTLDNFRQAYKNAIKGKKHYIEVKQIEKNVDLYLSTLLNQVKTKTYKVSKYKIFKLFSGGKWRDIAKLPMRDRIVQHAIMIHLEPIFRENFILDTYSSIKTRGIHLGLKRVKRAVKDTRYRYCLKLDIHKCYPSIDQRILKEKLKRKFKDKNLLDLLFTIIDSYDSGVPIGNYTSQYFNNFYFSSFDHWLKEQRGVKYYFRYCDDMVILGKSKLYLHNIFDDIVTYILQLNVQLKSNYLIFPIEDRSIDFLGYKIREKYVLVRNRTKFNFKRKINNINFQNLTKKNINVLGSYWGILIHANCKNLWYRYTNTKNFNELKV